MSNKLSNLNSDAHSKILLLNFIALKYQTVSGPLVDLETRTTLPHTHITLTLLEIHRPTTILLLLTFIYDIDMLTLKLFLILC